MALTNDPSVRRHSYAALESPEHIRLITLHPAMSKDAPLRINFCSSTLEDVEGRYEAVSYTWGQPILAFALHVDDGTQVFVTENLDRALRYLRRADRDRLLWADAASINQVDNEEKAVQIPLMVQIFRGARRVMAWLDPGGDTTVEQQGMRELNRLSRASTIQLEALHDGFSDVLRFLSLPLFNRLWIVQEVVFNLDIHLICGGMELTFSRLVVALSVLQRHIRVNELHESRMAVLDEMGKLWNRHSLFGKASRQAPSSTSEGATQILSLVEGFRLYGCTDPRDRILALYSMATDVRHSSQAIGSTSGTDERVSMNIDCSLDVYGTYQAFALSCWERPRTHGKMWEALLSRQHSPQPTDLASWAPDWRVLPRDKWRIGSNLSRNPQYLEYPDMKVHTMGLRMGFNHRGSTQDVGLKDLCTVQLKTSRTPADDQTSFLAQLSQLHMLLQNPRRSLHLSGLPSKLSQNVLGTRSILIDMIKVSFPLVSNEDIIMLEQHLAEMAVFSEKAGSACNTIAPPVRVQEIVHKLVRRLATNEFFCFQDPRTQVYSVGIGNKNMEIGDQIVLLDGSDEHPEVQVWRESLVVFILRKVGHLDDTQLPVFRFIGSGYVLNYNCVFPPKSVRRHVTRNKKTRVEEAAWEEFQMSFLRDKHFRWLNLV